METTNPVIELNNEMLLTERAYRLKVETKISELVHLNTLSVVDRTISRKEIKNMLEECYNERALTEIAIMELENKYMIRKEDK